MMVSSRVQKRHVKQSLQACRPRFLGHVGDFEPDAISLRYSETLKKHQPPRNDQRRLMDPGADAYPCVLLYNGVHISARSHLSATGSCLLSASPPSRRLALWISLPMHRSRCLDQGVVSIDTGRPKTSCSWPSNSKEKRKMMERWVYSWKHTALSVVQTSIASPEERLF